MSMRLLSRDFAFYGVLDFLQRGMAVLLVPVYTRVLSQESYGNLDLILTASSTITVLLDLQFVVGFSRLYLEQRREGAGGRLVGTAIMTRVGIAAVLAAVFICLGFMGALEFRFLPSFLSNRAAWVIAALTVPVSFIFDILLVQSQMLRWKKWFLAGALGNTLLLTLLSVVFTVFIPLGIVGVLLAQLIAKVISSTVLLFGLRREVSFEIDRNQLRDMARYTLPLVPGRWLGHVSGYTSRFFVYASFGATANAILAITTKLAAVVGLFSVAFRTAWQPLAMSYIGEENSEQFYVRSLRLFTAGGLMAIFFLTIATKPILFFLAPRSYAAAESYVPFFLIATVIAELDVNLQLGNQISKKTHWISISAGVAFAVELMILATLTGRLGIYAACISALAACIAKVAITYFTGQRNYRIEYDKRSLSILAFGCSTLIILSLLRSGGILNEPLFFVVVFLLGVLLPWFAFPPAERYILRRLPADLLKRITTGGRTETGG